MGRTGRATNYARDRWRREFLKQNAQFRRYVLRELEQRGPLLSRDLEDRSSHRRDEHRWYGNRYVGRMLQILHVYGEIAVVGRRGGQRPWDLARRRDPETGTLAARGVSPLGSTKRWSISNSSSAAEAPWPQPDRAHKNGGPWSTTTSSWVAVPPVRCLRLGCRRNRPAASCCWRRVRITRPSSRLP